ncbi:MAG: hypothetical protein ACE37F_10175 [Nannocystaceae bacterium]|nr:hypothetical protein [bacterium]
MDARWTCLLCALALSGCDDAPTSDTDEGSTGAVTSSSSSGDPTTSQTSSETTEGTSSSTGEAEASSGDTSSGGDTSTGTPPCDGFVPGDAFEIAADVSNTRIHPHAAGDDTGAWFSFVHPEPAGSLFDVSVMHLRCESDVDVPPQVVNTSPGNDIDASIAVSGERVMVVWNSDDGLGGDSNLQIHGRVLDLSGEPTSDAQFRVTTQVAGVDITQNHTLASVTPTADGFAISGLRAHPESPAFVAFDQALSPSGAPTSEAFGAPIEEAVSHLAAFSSRGWLAYGRSGVSSDTVWLAHPDTAAAAAFDGQPATAGFILDRPDAPGAPLLAGTLGSGNALDIGVALGTGTPLVLGAPGSLEHSPTVAMNEQGALAVVFHRNIAGLNNAVVFQRLAVEGDAVVAVGEAEELDTQSPPYPASLTWTPGGWLATWSRGSSPDFTTWGRVLAER